MKKQQKKLALSMRGGGMKVGAYLGVLDVLEEEGIEVDMIIGSSGGAYVGALYALGRSVDEIQEHMEKQHFRNYFGWDAIKDLSLFSDDMTVPFLRQIAGDAKIEDTKIKLMIQATDLNNETLTVFDKGDLAGAIYASMAMPVLVKPYEMDGKLYADGDIYAGYEASFLREQGAEVVVGMTPLNEQHVPEIQNHSGMVGRALDAYWIMVKRIRELEQKLDPVDLLLDDLATPDVGLLDIKKGIALRERGREIAKAKIPEIKELLVNE